MRLLFVGNFLSEKGNNPSAGEELAKRLQKQGYSVITTSNRRSRFFRFFDMLTTVWMRRADYEVAYVETYSGPAFLWAEYVCRILRLLCKPYVLALHGGNLPAFAQCSTSRVEQLLKAANKVTVPSSYLLEEMRFYRGDICLLPNPIELECYSFRPRLKPTPHFIWLRAFHALYNPQMAVRSTAILSSIFPEIHLTMIGPDKGDGTLQETQALIKELGLQCMVEIVPGVPKSKVPQYLGRADIFMNTTTVDNTPVSVLEAMACGLCIVSTNIGGLPYLLDDGFDALLVPPNDPEAIAAAVRRILTEPGLAERLSRNGRKKAESFDWSIILPQWEALFEELVR